MKEGIVGSAQSGSSFEQTGWAMVWLVGCGAAVIGLSDLALLVYPPQWASLDWEFATVAGVIIGLPLVTIGLGLMAAASIAREARRLARLSSLMLLFGALMLLILLTVFALDIPAAYRATPPTAREGLNKAVAKTLLMGVVDISLYATLGVWTWRRLRTLKGAAR